MKFCSRPMALLMTWVISFLIIPEVALSQEEGGPIISEPAMPVVSAKVRELPVMDPWMAGSSVRKIPRQTGGFKVDAAQTPPEKKALMMRQSVQSSRYRTPDPILSFEGIGMEEGGGYVPPDTVGDVGPNHYVQMVNTAFAVFDKNGNQLVEPTAINQLWQGQGNPCETQNDGDPVVLYDSLADRWLLSQFAVSQDPPYYECIAISQTPDPTGAYFLYAFEIPDDAFPDYPKLAVWPDAYYMSTNEMDDKAFVGVYAFDREKMLAGEPGTFQKFIVERNFMLPSDLDGSEPPPAGSPNYFYTIMDDTFWPSQGFPGEDRIEVWEFHVDFETPANSTFTMVHTLETPFDYLVCEFFVFDCIPQKDTEQKVDALSEWPMWRFQYRNFGTHETLVGNFTVDVGDFAGHAGIRWFELRKSNSSWSIHQEGTHAPDEHHRWMGSIAMDGAGNITLGYSVSSDTLFPSIRYATRFASDPAGTLQQETTVITGTASQTRWNRWGDYSSMNVDPSDDATFWYTSEYIPDSGFWQTRIAKFKIQPTATTGSATSLTESSVSLDGTVDPNGIDTNYYFEYGSGQTYGSASTRALVDSGSGIVSVNAEISGLNDHAIYHYRLVATNESGTSYGDDSTFTTLTAANVVNQAVTEGTGGSGGCFIATAAFGTPMAREIVILEKFRDCVLMTHAAGRFFVRFYYRFSPPMAHFIGRHDTLRATARWCILPFVGISWMALKFGPVSTLGLLLLLTLMSAIGLVFLRKTHLRRHMN